MSEESKQRLMTLGDRIRQQREKQKLTQEQLAEEMDISRNSVANIEAGANFKIDTLISVCLALNITPNDLLQDFVPESDVNSNSSDKDLMRLLVKYEKLQKAEKRKCLQFFELALAQYSGDEVFVDVKEQADFFWHR